MQKNTKKKCYKRPAFWLILTTIIIGGLYWLGYIPYWYDSTKENIAEWQDERYFKNIEKQQSELERLYKADTYGGDTPEETMEMFIHALEKNDLKLASKYYLVEKQEQVEAELESSLPLDIYIEILKGESKGTLFKNGTTYEILYFQEGEQIHFERLVLNKYTNKWKILEL